MNPISMIVPDTGAAFTTTVVISGIGIVLGMLILLILIFYAFGKIVSSAEGASKKRQMQKKEEKMEQEAKSAPVAVASSAPVPEVQNGISDEVVAVIAAAVAASEGPGVVVRSIKRKKVSGRNPWANAAVIDNTRPF